MKQYIKPLAKTWMLGLVLIAGLAACDTTNNSNGDLADAELSQLSGALSDELSLSGDQETALNNSLARHGDRRDREPGFLWTVAADLQAMLTDEQKAELFARTDEFEQGLSFRGLLGFPGAGGYYGLGGFMGGSHHHGLSPEDDILNLTADQEAALQEIHSRYRDQFKALADSFEAGEITEDDLVAGLIALRSAKQAEVLDVLTDEQEAALEAFRAEREAELEAFRQEVNAVRNEVLGLTTEQADAMDALYTEQLEARESLIEQLEAGTLSVADFQAEIEALEAARQEVLAGMLDAVQYEIVQIHDALAVRSGKFGHHGMRGDFGRGPGHGHTFGG